MFGILRKYRTRQMLESDPVGYARSIGVTVGERCRFIEIDGGTFGSEPWLIRIGEHVTITEGVRFITHDGGVWVFRDNEPEIDVFGPITLGNNVFIGMNVILMPGVTVGDNCVIGAGSIVTRDIPANSVAVGSPARVVRALDEYRERIRDKATFIRSRPQDEKRRLLRERFFGKDAR